MELILTELLSLAIVSIIIFAIHERPLASRDATDTQILNIALTYFGYLLLSLVSHVHMKGVFHYGLFVSRLIIILHTVSIPFFILVWMSAITKKILGTEKYHILRFIQVLVLCIFAIASLFDVTLERFYIFSDSGAFRGGIAITVMLYISCFYALITLTLVIFLKRRIDHSLRFLFFLAPSFILLSLLFFHIFKEPTLFAISSSFNLLLMYLFYQRKAITLDTLTRVSNRSAFLDRMKHLADKDQKATLILFDIENFRLINARYSNAIGDILLTHFALFLSDPKLNAEVYRLVGNRFVLVFPLLQHNEIVRVVRATQKRCAEGYRIRDTVISFFVNVAIVQLPLANNSVEEIVESLDFTLAEIKEKRRHSAIIFNQKLIHLRQRRLDVLSAIKRTIQDPSNMVVHYQPIIDIHDNSIIGAEALMRIQDDQLGMISPGEFIVAAESSGLISQLTLILVQKVCSFLIEISSFSTHLSHISINISAADLASREVVQQLLAVIEASGIDMGMIGFEVTESMLINSKEATDTSWKAFEEKGMHFLLDDFGTGYSNLQTLVNLPFRTVKIDRSVVSNSKNNYELITLISAMLSKLGKQMIAEGVETKEQLLAVQENGICYVQGYYFSKPVSEKDFLSYLSGAMCIIPRQS